MKDSIDDRTSASPPSQPLDLPKGRLGWDPEFALYSFSKWMSVRCSLILSSKATWDPFSFRHRPNAAPS
jgi:hypothetical protein